MSASVRRCSSLRIARRALQIDLSNRCVVERIVSKCNIDNIFGVLEDVVVVLVLSVEQNNTKQPELKQSKLVESLVSC